MKIPDLSPDGIHRRVFGRATHFVEPSTSRGDERVQVAVGSGLHWDLHINQPIEHAYLSAVSYISFINN